MENNIKNIHEIITFRFKNYVESIIEIYGTYMGENNLNRIKQIRNYSDHVIIGTNNSINAHASNNGVYLPIEAISVLEDLKKIKEYGTNKNHKLYDEHTLIINDNTFFDYIKHVIVTGSTPLDYYEDLLLHETLHFCGSDGGSALKEGMNEYLTRKIASKRNFRTSACGYPKEVKVVYELEKIFGEEIINEIAFIKDNREIFNLIEHKLGKKAKELYVSVLMSIEEEFYQKYFKYMNTYNGLEDVYQEAINYSKIDYKKTFDLINKYKKLNTK